MDTPDISQDTQNLMLLLQEEERNLNADVQVEAISVCGVLAQAILSWQEQSPTIKTLSFSAADIINHACLPVYHFLNQDDDVPLQVKAALCKVSFGCISPHYLDTTYKGIKEARIEERRPSSHWERCRYRLRFQAHDLVLAQLPLLYQTLSNMGYLYYASTPAAQSRLVA